jgi:NAD dependent epimerase/dehydratase family enzyme
VNATAPGVVRNRTFSRALGRVLHRPALLPIPPLALRLRFGAVAEVLTASQRCVPAVAQRLQHAFLHPAVEGALAAVLRR